MTTHFRTNRDGKGLYTPYPGRTYPSMREMVALEPDEFDLNASQKVQRRRVLEHHLRAAWDRYQSEHGGSLVSIEKFYASIPRV